MKIVISGFDAAGKTTHGSLLSSALDIPLHTASGLMTRLAHRAHNFRARWDDQWTPELDQVRAADPSLDEEIDADMVKALVSSPSGVFDGCFLPWLVRPDGVINVWIESDLDSRVRKCMVRHLGDGIDRRTAEQIVRNKDDFSQRRLQSARGVYLSPDPNIFDLVLDNSDLIPEATVACAHEGIRTLQPVLLRCIDYLGGARTSRPRSRYIRQLGRR
jgi:cytidylate kinase